MTVAAGRFSALAAFPPSSSVLVCSPGTKTPAALYADKISGTTISNPVTTDTLGNLSFFAVAGDYDLVFAYGDVTRVVTVTVPPDPTQAWPG